MLKVILTGIQNGIPLIKGIAGLFKKKKNVDAIGSSNEIPKPEVDDKIVSKIIALVIEGATVYFVIYISHKFGITYQDVIGVFGLVP